MKRGVPVAVRVEVAVDVGKAVMTKRGVLVVDADKVSVVVAVPEAVMVAVPVSVCVAVWVAVDVPVSVWVAVCVVVAVWVTVCVEVGVGGRAEGLTEAASLPTVISTPQTCGRDRVAE